MPPAVLVNNLRRTALHEFVGFWLQMPHAVRGHILLL